MLYLTQSVTFPTHLHSSGLGSCLDLISSNIPNQLNPIQHLPPLGVSDHALLMAEFFSSKSFPTAACTYRSPPSTQRYNVRSTTDNMWNVMNDFSRRCTMVSGLPTASTPLSPHSLTSSRMPRTYILEHPHLIVVNHATNPASG